MTTGQTPEQFARRRRIQDRHNQHGQMLAQAIAEGNTAALCHDPIRRRSDPVTLIACYKPNCGSFPGPWIARIKYSNGEGPVDACDIRLANAAPIEEFEVDG